MKLLSLQRNAKFDIFLAKEDLSLLKVFILARIFDVYSIIVGMTHFHR